MEIAQCPRQREHSGRKGCYHLRRHTTGCGRCPLVVILDVVAVKHGGKSDAYKLLCVVPLFVVKRSLCAWADRNE